MKVNASWIVLLVVHFVTEVNTLRLGKRIRKDGLNDSVELLNWKVKSRDYSGSGLSGPCEFLHETIRILTSVYPTWAYHMSPRTLGNIECWCS